MRKSSIKAFLSRSRDGLPVGLLSAAMVITVLLGIAGPSAANVLFSYSTGTCSVICSGRPNNNIGTVAGPTLMTTPNGTGGADFTIPSRLFSETGSSTGAFPPVYPYFRATFNRYWIGGSVMAGAWSPNAVYTFFDDNTQYPYAPTNPSLGFDGFIRANVGPKGNAGPNMYYAGANYTSVRVGSGGVYDATFQVRVTLGGPVSTNPNRGGRSAKINTAPPYTAGGIVDWNEPNIWSFTGTMTVSQPPPYGPTFYFVDTGMDNRTAAGQSGTIQLVSAQLAHKYNVAPLPATYLGDATVTAYQSGFASTRFMQLRFLPVPEPGQLAMLSVGVIGIAGIWNMRRRS